MDAILKASKVVKYFNEPEPFQVLKGVSFDVNKGEFLSIVGKSGCGKSTLLYILSTMDTDFEGGLEIKGQNLRGWSQNDLARFRMKTWALCFSSIICYPNFRH